MMKKFLTLFLAMLLPLCTALAETPESCTVYVSISDETGALALAYAPVTVTDADGDGLLTLCDALLAAHIAYHPHGAEAFQVAETQYGLSLTMLWGTGDGNSYGYCLNDASAWSLADPIQAGDHVKAYAYTDLIAWSDAYSFFAAPSAETAVGAPLPLTLSAAGYDELWNPVTLPVSGAVITVDGQPSPAATDENGCAAMTFAAPGTYVVSAVHDGMTLVPPVCVVTVTEAAQ